MSAVLRLVNRLAGVVGVQVVPSWSLQWAYSEKTELEQQQRARLRGLTPRRADRINVGSGADIRPGWLNIDSRPLQSDSETFLCADLLLLDHYLADACASEILAQDVLEHFSWRDVDDLIATLTKKLAPGGRLTVQSPNLDALITGYRSGRLAFGDFERYLYGDQTYPANTHRCAFSPAVIRKRLERVGLMVESVETVQTNVRAVGRKRPSASS